MCLIVSDVFVFCNYSGLGQGALFSYLSWQKQQEFQKLKRKDKQFYDNVNHLSLEIHSTHLIDLYDLVDALQKKMSFLIS
jgi:hypothetical protein